MAQMLTVCRLGTEWGFRDVTGAEYGHSSDINFTVEAAQHTAERSGGHVVFTPEAEEHYRSRAPEEQSVDTPPPAAIYYPSKFRTFVARLAQWRWGKM
jgi:hypothetical protein